MPNHHMTVTREVTVAADLDEVWRLLADPDELAAWVGDDVRTARVEQGADGLTWTWAPGGVESTVEVTLVREAERTTVRVTERRAGARACTIGDAWDDRLLGLELRCIGLRCLAATPG